MQLEDQSWPGNWFNCVLPRSRKSSKLPWLLHKLPVTTARERLIHSGPRNAPFARRLVESMGSVNLVVPLERNLEDIGLSHSQKVSNEITQLIKTFGGGVSCVMKEEPYSSV